LRLCAFAGDSLVAVCLLEYNPASIRQSDSKEHRMKLRYSNISRVLFLLTGLLFAHIVTAQESEKIARNFDQFEGLFSSCDLGAHLDNFVIELQQSPDAIGYLICYGPGDKGSSSIVRHRLDYMKDYLVNTRGMSAERIQIIEGGRYEKLKDFYTELWIAPREALAPEPRQFENNAKTFKGMFAEYEFWEGPVDVMDGFSGNVTLAGLADVLRQQPESRTYVVVQNTVTGTPGAWRRAADEVTSNLQNNFKIGADRIKVICAGYEAKAEGSMATVQLWVLPKDAPPPAEEASGPEPRPKEAIQWREFGGYELASDDDNSQVLKNFADVLRGDKELGVCIIVRRLSASRQAAEAEANANPRNTLAETELAANAELDLPKVDLTEVVVKWQAALAKEYGISNQRLTVITVEAEEYFSDSLEVWFVPPGAKLPDPFAKDEEEVIEDEAMETELPNGN
jgi:hypothetical protein